MTTMKLHRMLYRLGMKIDVDRIIRYGVDVGVAALVVGGYLMGFGVGPFDFNPLNIATATFLLVVRWACR